MTGRKGRVVSTDEGISYESRSEQDVPLEMLNLTEKQRFMDGEKVSNMFVSYQSFNGCQNCKLSCSYILWLLIYFICCFQKDKKYCI